MRVLVLGADGFIGRHIAFYLRDQGVEVLAHARNPSRLAEMGFDSLAADLADPVCHDASFWRPHLRQTHLLNAAGLLTGSEAAFRAVHELAPAAALTALEPGFRALHLSAVGIAGSKTPFAFWRRRTEAVFQGHTILRAGLVLGDTSYGGSSMLRALAALPFVTPVVGNGVQRFNPIHASDLAAIALDCLRVPPPPDTYDIGGPEIVTQTALTQSLRRWLGLRPVRVLRLPLRLAKAMGRLGDLLRFGPISATAVAQLESGVLADPAPLLVHLSRRPRGVTEFLFARPAGTQDLWHARTYLLKPLIRLTLAGMWLASAALGFLTPAASFLPLLPDLPAPLMTALARLGGGADALLGLALLANWRPKMVGIAQLLMVLAYTLGLGLMAPALWLDPFGGLLKNLPILALILVHLALAEER